MTVADRIAVMDHGKMIQVAPPAEIYEQPNSRYVADFIGSINLLEGQVVSAAGNVIRMAAPDLDATFEVEDDAECAGGQKAWFAVRPEKMRMTLDAPTGGAFNTLPGEVWDIGYLGDASIYHVKLKNGQMVRATVTNTDRLVERPIGWDDKVWLTWPRDAGVVLTK